MFIHRYGPGITADLAMRFRSSLRARPMAYAACFTNDPPGYSDRHVYGGPVERMGAPGAGGNARAWSQLTALGAADASATASGGAGGAYGDAMWGSSSGSDGGSASSTAKASAGSSSNASAVAFAYGGVGSDSLSESAGHGGVASAFASATSASGAVAVSALQKGGDGGNGDSSGSVGAGADSLMDNAVSGFTTGALSLTQTAIAGSGGDSAYGNGGEAGNARSTLSILDTTAAKLTATVNATAGNRGNAGRLVQDSPPEASAGSNASSRLEVRMASAGAAIARGGAGGTGNAGAGAWGAASASALASSSTQASATAQATGGASVANASASASQVRASASADGQGSITAAAGASKTATYALDEVPAGTQAYSYASGAADAGAIASRANVTAAFNGGTVYGAGVQGVNYAVGATQAYTSTGQYSITLGGTSSLILGLLDFTAYGTGFDQLTLSIADNGSLLYSRAFSSLGEAELFFSDGTLNLGSFSAGLQLLTVTSSFLGSGDGGFGFSYALAGTAVSAVPEAQTWLMLIAGLGMIVVSARRARRFSVAPKACA
jgi:hypothetical protein